MTFFQQNHRILAAREDSCEDPKPPSNTIWGSRQLKEVAGFPQVYSHMQPEYETK